jgi:hypothetical protein
VSALLEHLSLALTTTSLRRLERIDEHSGERTVEASGVALGGDARPRQASRA